MLDSAGAFLQRMRTVDLVPHLLHCCRGSKRSLYSKFGEKEELQRQTLPMYKWACEYCIKTALKISEPLMLCCQMLNSNKGHCEHVGDLQVWHIQAPVLEMSSWCEPSVSFPPSLCLSRAGLTPPGLSPTQTAQLEMSKQWDQMKTNRQFQWQIIIIMTGQ